MQTSAHYVQFAVAPDFLTGNSASNSVEFDLYEPTDCQDQPLASPVGKLDFALVRATQCNGALLSELPLVEFRHIVAGNVPGSVTERVRMTIVEPLPAWLPGLVQESLVSLCVEIYPKISRSVC